MKSNTRYSPRYFADFADAFKPVTKPVVKLGAKLKKLAQEARRGAAQSAVSEQQKRDWPQLMVHDPIGGEGNQWFTGNTKNLYQDYYRDRPKAKLNALTHECAAADNDCRHEATGSKVNNKYSCSHSSDEYFGAAKPPFDPMLQHEQCAREAWNLYTTALDIETPEEKADAKKGYEAVQEWIENLPMTNKPDHIHLSSREGDESSTESVEKSKNDWESTSRLDESSVVSASQGTHARKAHSSESFSPVDSLTSSIVEEQSELNMIDMRIKAIDAVINPNTKITAQGSLKSSLPTAEAACRK